MLGSWHQQQAFKRDGFPKLSHSEYWTCYNTKGHLSVIRFETKEQAETYSQNTGDSIIPPDNANEIQS